MTNPHRVPIKSVRVAADVSERERSAIEIMRTETPAFQSLITSRRNRHEEWFQFQANRIDINNLPVPVRQKP
jgi:peptidylprolyl isomerase